MQNKSQTQVSIWINLRGGSRALELIRGSHKHIQTFYNRCGGLDENKRVSIWLIDACVKDLVRNHSSSMSSVRVETRPGDAIFFTGNVVHRGWWSPHCRASIALRYRLLRGNELSGLSNINILPRAAVPSFPARSSHAVAQTSVRPNWWEVVLRNTKVPLTPTQVDAIPWMGATCPIGSDPIDSNGLDELAQLVQGEDRIASPDTAKMLSPPAVCRPPVSHVDAVPGCDIVSGCNDFSKDYPVTPLWVKAPFG